MKLISLKILNFNLKFLREILSLRNLVFERKFAAGWISVRTYLDLALRHNPSVNIPGSRDIMSDFPNDSKINVGK